MSWSNTSAMNGRPWIGSFPSTYSRSPAGDVFISGVGTNACRALGMPCDFTVLRTSCANT